MDKRIEAKTNTIRGPLLVIVGRQRKLQKIEGRAPGELIKTTLHYSKGEILRAKTMNVEKKRKKKTLLAAPIQFIK